jgi:hypothetical protein
MDSDLVLLDVMLYLHLQLASPFFYVFPMDWSGIQEFSNKKGIITSILIVDVRRAFFFLKNLSKPEIQVGLRM